MSKENGRWLRAQRQAHAWNVPKMAHEMRAAATAAGDTVPTVATMEAHIRRWERGVINPSERYMLFYCKAFGIRADQYGPGNEAEPPLDAGQAAVTGMGAAGMLRGVGMVTPAPAATGNGPAARYLPARWTALPARPPGSGSLAPEDVAYGWRQEPDFGDSWIHREVLMTAHESSEQAEHAERRDIGDTTVEQMRTDVQRLSRQYMTGQPLPLFFEMRRVRDRMHTALDRRLWPRDATEIYFLLAALNGLMANAALDLGYHQAAEELIRAGWAYAIAIDHRPLMGFLRGKQASVAYWRGYPLRARELAQDGLAYLPDGTGAVLLHCLHAIPAARLGEPDEAAAAVTSAHEARDRGPRDVLHDEIGGEFGCSPAKESYLAGTALADMPQSEPAAIRELQTAVRLYSSGPAEERSYGCEALAHINLAVVHIRKGALDAVDLEPVFGLPSAKRIDALPQRLAAVRTELAQPIFRGSAQARELGERIEEFNHDTVVADLHDLPGGPA